MGWSSISWRVCDGVCEEAASCRAGGRRLRGCARGAATAHAAGGLSVTPASLENRAKLGTVGSLTLNNTTKESLRVTVNVRPWRQQLNGRVLRIRARTSRGTSEPRRARSRSAPAPSARSASAWCGAGSGSLYGSVDILGKPTNTKGRKGIIPNYRLITRCACTRARRPTGCAPARPRCARARSSCRSATSATRSTRSAARSACRGPASRSGNVPRVAASRASSSARPDLHARDEEGPLHRQRDGHAGQQAANVRTSFTIR